MKPLTLHILSKDSLPYIDALIQEVLRWNMIVPLAIPHASTQDDDYKGRLQYMPISVILTDYITSPKGYLIPKGSTVICNAWAISQDPKQYPDPEKFDPERYLKRDGQDKPLDPRLYCFGVGRR